MELKRTIRKTLDRLGVAYTEERVGWRGSERYGWAPILVLVVSDDDYAAIVAPDRKASLARRTAANKRARARAEDARVALDRYRREDSARLHLLPDSRTYQAYLAGEIDEAEATRIGEYMEYRHEDTDYDDLLRQGYAKDDARAMMCPVH